MLIFQYQSSNWTYLHIWYTFPTKCANVKICTQCYRTLFSWCWIQNGVVTKSINLRFCFSTACWPCFGNVSSIWWIVLIYGVVSLVGNNNDVWYCPTLSTITIGERCNVKKEIKARNNRKVLNQIGTMNVNTFFDLVKINLCENIHFTVHHK